MCKVIFWSTSLRNKYCRCKTCPCSAGTPTTTDLGIDKDFRGPSEFDSSDVYAKERPNIYDGTDGTKIKLKESDLIKLVQKIIKEGREDGYEYSVDRPHVCVKGECYKRKDAPGVSCNSGDDAGWGQGGKCFKSGRACRDKC
jgi:hypothetical protein